eukprot:Rhum_TRINITY_DN11815_c1_g1::Rhum_TRINITY_DN11815_c1_g1_i1::g.47313::m.47313
MVYGLGGGGRGARSSCCRIGDVFFSSSFFFSSSVFHPAPAPSFPSSPQEEREKKTLVRQQIGCSSAAAPSLAKAAPAPQQHQAAPRRRTRLLHVLPRLPLRLPQRRLRPLFLVDWVHLRAPRRHRRKRLQPLVQPVVRSRLAELRDAPAADRRYLAVDDPRRHARPHVRVRDGVQHARLCGDGPHQVPAAVGDRADVGVLAARLVLHAVVHDHELALRQLPPRPQVAEVPVRQRRRQGSRVVPDVGPRRQLHNPLPLQHPVVPHLPVRRVVQHVVQHLRRTLEQRLHPHLVHLRPVPHRLGRCEPR